MATATLNASAAQSPSFGQIRQHAPVRSSPLACASPAAQSRNSISDVPSMAARRAQCFPTSRPLRPFASISSKATSKPVKSFELPEAFKSGCFMLNLTQAEFSRQV